MFFRIESRGVILEMLNERSRFGSFLQDFGLAFIYATPFVHDIQVLKRLLRSMPLRQASSKGPGSKRKSDAEARCR